jgi:hypothetical protein
MSQENKPAPPRIVYCHCAYSQVVPKETKEAVLKHLCENGIEFEAAPDLCEMSARKDPALRDVATSGPLKIAACYPRAVKWLFSAAGIPLSQTNTEVINMRTEGPDDVIQALGQSEISPNLPAGKETMPTFTSAEA